MFINTQTLEYPVSYAEIKKQNPHISFPANIDVDFLKTIGYDAVEQQPLPTNLKRNEYAEIGAPEFDGEKWILPYVVRQYSFTDLIDPTTNEPIDPVEAENRFIESVKRQIKAEIAQHRYEVETAGIVVNGAKIKTDRGSQATITGAYVTTLIDPTTTINWKGENGWVTLDAAAIAVIATAVTNHVQTCFNKEKALNDLLETLTPAQLYQFDVKAEWDALP